MTHASLYKVSTTIGVQLTLSYHQHWCQLKCRQIEFEVDKIIFLQMKKSRYTCEFLVSAGVVQAGKVWILFIYMGVCNAGTLTRQDIISISPHPQRLTSSLCSPRPPGRCPPPRCSPGCSSHRSSSFCRWSERLSWHSK